MTAATIPVDRCRAGRRAPHAVAVLLLVLAAACAPGSTPATGITGSLAPPASAVAATGAGAPATTAAGQRMEVTGIVVSVEGGLGATNAFTLRIADGRQLLFRVGRVDLDGEAFPAQHLREHQAAAEPVAVTYVREGPDLVAVRLEDAP